MKRKIFALALLLFCGGTTLLAQSKLADQAKNDIVQNTKFGGYVIGRAAFNDRDISTANTKHSDFDLRLVRAYVNGKVLDFAYRLQVEYEGYGGTKEKGPHIVDAYLEWQKYSF